jgi:hypothetical protein
MGQTEILHIEEKGQSLNTFEWFHIYSLRKQRLKMNDAFTDTHNPIFDIIIKTSIIKIKYTPKYIPTTAPTKI